MGDSNQAAMMASGQDRRSSIRVKSRLPCSVRRIEVTEIAAIEAKILDMAVLESDGVMSDAVDWRDHTEDLSPEMVYVLNEVRALRQQLTQVQRVMERHGQRSLEERWLELNDQGLWIPMESGEEEWTVGDLAEIRIRIPSLQTPEIRAIGEVLRLDPPDGDGLGGTVFFFRAISQPHKRAISKYALRRERQMARSLRFTF